MRWQVVADYSSMSAYGATCIYQAIVAAANAGTRFNLGLATGNTMIELYRVLADKLNRQQVSLENVHTYNLDEYVDDTGSAVPENHPLSYRKYMQDHLFSRFDAMLGFREDHIHFPDPCDPARFDRELSAAGGLNLQLLGIGFNGHIAFNEPESADVVSREIYAARPSRVIPLTPLTLATNARLTAGGNLDRMPRHAVTMGMASILGAREIMLLACFAEQQAPLQRMQTGSPTPELPASYLLTHANATIVYTADTIQLN
ncbi:MAG TPA: glucosamine-6-phosphate deaminase [Armatimonadota bacterium]|nr:glucosamine-6-phosphate deaminase [Armatimonadota bacterium]